MADERQEDYIEIKIPDHEEQAPAKTAPAPVKKKTVNKKTAKKKTAKKKTKKPVVHKKKESNGNWLWAALLIIGLIVIAAVIYLALKDNTQAPDDEKRIAALVNGQPIYKEQIDEIYNKIPATMQGQVDEVVILEQLIEQELLVQEAKKLGITVTNEEVEVYIESMLQYFAMSREELSATLAEQQMTEEQFLESTKQQILTNKLVNQTVYQDIDITEEEIEQQYENNKELYAIPATATVKHILISPEENESETEVIERAEAIVDMIDEDKENFCDLVENYTQDPASIPSCGEYVITQDGRYVPEFETSAFAMDIEEIRLVSTQFGQHIMWKIAAAKAGYLELEDVAAVIEQELFQAASTTAVRAYIDALRDQATIEKYPLEAEVIVPVTSEEEEAQEEELQVEVEKTKPIREGDFGKCLTDLGAELYGVSWSPDVEKQQEALGEALEEVTYIDCDPAEGNAPATCDDITVYPTWIIDGEKVEGMQSMNALSQATGCQP